MGTSSLDKKILVILGPTSTGKTDLALKLAKKFNGELISADSRQVYKGLDLGTGKLPGEDLKIEKGRGYWIMDDIKVWMYDILDPKKQYSVYDFVKNAERVISQIRVKGKLPIIVGGTGLYLKGLLYGFSNLGIPMDKKLRKTLEDFTLEQLQKKLQNLSIKKWVSLNSSDQKNPRRLIRAIELGMHKGKQIKSRIKKFDTLKIGLTTSKDILFKRINQRIEKRIKMGMIEEAKTLHQDGLSLKRMRQLGLEYGVLADFLEGKASKDQLIKILQGKIHAYARRQITWFKKEEQVNWFNITSKDFKKKVEKLLVKWYYQYDAAQD